MTCLPLALLSWIADLTWGIIWDAVSHLAQILVKEARTSHTAGSQDLREKCLMKRNFSRFNGRGVTFQQKVTTSSQTVFIDFTTIDRAAYHVRSVYRTPVRSSHGNSCNFRIGPLCLWLQSLRSSCHIETRGNEAVLPYNLRLAVLWRDCMAAASLKRRAGAATTLTRLLSGYGSSRRYVLLNIQSKIPVEYGCSFRPKTFELICWWLYLAMKTVWGLWFPQRRTEEFCGFLQFLEAKSGMVSWTETRPLPSTFYHRHSQP